MYKPETCRQVTQHFVHLVEQSHAIHRIQHDTLGFVCWSFVAMHRSKLVCSVRLQAELYSAQLKSVSLYMLCPEAMLYNKARGLYSAVLETWLMFSEMDINGHVKLTLAAAEQKREVSSINTSKCKQHETSGYVTAGYS